MSRQIKLAIKTAEVFEPLQQPARFKGLWGGRGSGKSHTLATNVVLACYQRGARVVCVREIQRSIADSVKQLIEDKIEEYGLSAAFRITDQEIRGTNGSLIIFRGLQNHTAESIKSLEGFHIAWVEEAQTISQRSLDLLLPTIRANNSELWFSWNPNNETDPIDRLLREQPPDNAIVIMANWQDNPWFPESLRGDMERDRDRDPDKYQHVWQGQYQSRSEARIFRNWCKGELNPPDNVVWFYGVDWGFSVDPTAALRCCIMGQTLYVDHEAYQVGCSMEATPALLHKVPGIHKWPSRADSARPETIDYMKRNGFPLMRGAKKGKGSIEDGITFIQGFDVVVHPRCVNLLHEFANYAYKTDKMTGDILPIVEDTNNHLIDALRYAVEGLHRKGVLIPPEAPPKTRHRSDYGLNDEDEGSNWKVA